MVLFDFESLLFFTIVHEIKDRLLGIVGFFNLKTESLNMEKNHLVVTYD